VAERAVKLSRLAAIEDLNRFGMLFETVRIDLPDAGKNVFEGPSSDEPKLPNSFVYFVRSVGYHSREC
jgi:hypothetical protein